jgi:hypothetical protein
VTEDSKGIWAIVGKLSALAILLLSLIQLYKYMVEPKQSLNAVAKFVEYKLPPNLAEIANSLDSALSRYSIEEILHEASRGGGKEGESSGRGITEAMDLSTGLRERVGLNAVRNEASYKSYWAISVINDGDLPVEGVFLRIPDIKSAAVSREGGSIGYDEIGPQIEIGKIGAGETVEVSAWSDSGVYFYTEDPSLHHEGGIGEVRVANRLSWANLLRESGPDLIFAASLIPIAVFSVTSIARIRRNKKILREKMQE